MFASPSSFLNANTTLAARFIRTILSISFLFPCYFPLPLLAFLNSASAISVRIVFTLFIAPKSATAPDQQPAPFAKPSLLMKANAFFSEPPSAALATFP
jgi:hypothetical protein